MYFTPVQYNYELMTSLIGMMYEVTIHTIDAGTIYTLGLQRATRYRDQILGVATAESMFVYRHRDILTLTLISDLLEKDRHPKTREYTGGDLPAALVPVEAYNTLSLLIPTCDARMLEKFGGKLTGSTVTGSIYYSGADPVESTSKHLHAFNTSHVEELQIALTPRDYAVKVHYTVHAYEQRKRHSDVLKSELKIGPLMRTIDCDSSLEGVVRLKAHLPESFEDFMEVSEEYEHTRNLLSGNFID